MKAPRFVFLALAALTFAFVPATSHADTKVLTFSGSYQAPACGPPFTFDAGTGTTTIDVVATTVLAVNDIVLKLYSSSGALLAQTDTGTSPEAIHYQPSGGVAAGTYEVVVCPFDPDQNLLTTEYTGTVTLTDEPLPPPPVPLPSPTTAQPSVKFDQGLAFAPATLVSAHWLCAEPQTALERPISRSEPGRINAQRIFVDCPVSHYTQTSLLHRSLDGGDSFRIVVDPACNARNRPNCATGGGGDSEEEVNLVTGDLFFADQEGLVVNEGVAMSSDHGDTFAPQQQFALTSPATATDRQWLTWADPVAVHILGHSIQAFLTYHVPAEGQYVIGIDRNGIPIYQPAPQIPAVGQSGQPRVDNSDGPARGWIYQPYRGFGLSGVTVGTAKGLEYQNPSAWRSTQVAAENASSFPWVAIDAASNAYVVWVDDNGDLELSFAPISDKRNDPSAGGRPGTYWTLPVSIRPLGLKSTYFPSITAGAAGRIGVAFIGSTDCNDKPAPQSSDNCTEEAHWDTYAAVISNAQKLATNDPATVVWGKVSHRTMHRGVVCTKGAGCSDDRSLLDTIDVGFDANGRLGVVSMDGNNKLSSPTLTTSDAERDYPFVVFAKQTKGPSVKGGTVDVSIADGARDDAKGDATWSNTSAGKNLPSLDLKRAALAVSGDKLVAKVGLADATKSGMARDLAAYNAALATDADASRLQYVVWFEDEDDVWHLSMQYANGNVTFFGGRLDQKNDDVWLTGSTGTVRALGRVGARYSADSDVHAKGELTQDGFKVSVPLADLGLGGGSKLYSVTVLAAAVPADNGTATSPSRTVDATPPFDAVVKSSAKAKSAGQTSSSAPSAQHEGRDVHK